MAEEDEDLVVKLGEPEPEPPVASSESAEKVAKPPPVPGPSSATPETGLRELQAQIEAERAERTRVTEIAQQIARERDQALQYAQEADRRGGTNYEAWVQSQIEGMAQELDSLAAHAEQAMGESDFKTVAEINKRIGYVGGKLAIREREKEALQQQREQQTKQPQQKRQQQPQQQPQRQQPTDPLERAIQGRTRPTQDFLRKHPDLVRGDGSLKKAAIDAHEKALDAGYAVDTEAYFQHIESLIGGNGAAQDSGQRVAIPGYSAPVARGPGPGSDNMSPGTFRMTPRMRKLAEEQGVSPTEWANNYVRLLKEGRITPIT